MEETDERSVFPRLQNDPWAKENIFFFQIDCGIHYSVTLHCNIDMIKKLTLKVFSVQGSTSIS